MRLIDADELIKVLNESLEGDVELIEDYELLGIDDFINAQPTAYDVDKVIKHLEAERDFWENAQCNKIRKNVSKRNFEYAINVVKAGGIVD